MLKKSLIFLFIISGSVCPKYTLDDFWELLALMGYQSNPAEELDQDIFSASKSSRLCSLRSYLINKSLDKKVPPYYYFNFLVNTYRNQASTKLLFLQNEFTLYNQNGETGFFRDYFELCKIFESVPSGSQSLCSRFKTIVESVFDCSIHLNLYKGKIFFDFASDPEEKHELCFLRIKKHDPDIRERYVSLHNFFLAILRMEDFLKYYKLGLGFCEVFYKADGSSFFKKRLKVSATDMKMFFLLFIRSMSVVTTKSNVYKFFLQSKLRYCLFDSTAVLYDDLLNAYIETFNDLQLYPKLSSGAYFIIKFFEDYASREKKREAWLCST